MKKSKYDYYVVNGEVLYMDFQGYLKIAEKALGYNHKEMARMLKVSYRSYQNWVYGIRFPAYPTREYLKNKIDLLLAIYADGGCAAYAKEE